MPMDSHNVFLTSHIVLAIFLTLFIGSMDFMSRGYGQVIWEYLDTVHILLRCPIPP